MSDPSAKSCRPARSRHEDSFKSSETIRPTGGARAKDLLHGIAATKPVALLPSSVTISKDGDKVEGPPGFFECNTVAHCGPTQRPVQRVLGVP